MTDIAGAVDEALILRMSGAGPRYTSYPTAPEWSDAFGDSDMRDALARAAQRIDEPLSLYVHIPFCERMCLFCGCTVEITKRVDKVTSYLDTLEREIAMTAEGLGKRRKALQIHWGGGTPTHLKPRELRRLFGILSSHFEILPQSEISIEVHPHVTSFEQIDTLVELGFNRISMGVQDLDPHVQAVIHRDQTTAETEALVAHCRARGIGGINLDLMYGLPEQSEATFAATLDTIARIRPDRLAVYAYAHVPWLKKHQTALERHHLPDAVERARLFFVALERLGVAGYEVIGLDHFALPTDPLFKALENGSLHRNFMGYTTHPADEMLAFGMSAIGDIGGAFVHNDKHTRDYEARIRDGRFATVRGLVRSPEDDLRRAAIQAVMCKMRLDLDDLEAQFASQLGGRARSRVTFRERVARARTAGGAGLLHALAAQHRRVAERTLVLAASRDGVRRILEPQEERRAALQPNGMSVSVDTLVVGAGISGLAFAHARAKHGDVLVLESSARAGGLVRTERVPDEFRGGEHDLHCELGPEALRAGAGELQQLLDELGLAVDMPPVNALKRFILLRGKLIEVPLAPQKLLTSSLLSPRGKLRLASEAWRDPKLGLDGSVADFARHRLGEEVLDVLIDPMVSGIHAGDPEHLSLRACFPRVVEIVEEHGSLIRGLRARRGGPALGAMRVRGGNQQLVDALAAALGDKLRLATPVRALAFDGGQWRVMTSNEDYSTRDLVLAVPSTTAARLLATVAPQLARAIGSIASESVVSVHHAYRRADVEHPLDGFGYLVPSREHQLQLGTLFSSSSDPSAIDSDSVLLRTLIGGARNPQVVDFDDAQLLDVVEREVGPALGLREPPLWSRIDRYRAVLPRFELGHPERVDAILELLPPGLSVLGNYLRGIGVNHLVDTAHKLAGATKA